MEVFGPWDPPQATRVVARRARARIKLERSEPRRNMARTLSRNRVPQWGNVPERPESGSGHEARTELTADLRGLRGRSRPWHPRLRAPEPSAVGRREEAAQPELVPLP